MTMTMHLTYFKWNDFKRNFYVPFDIYGDENNWNVIYFDFNLKYSLQSSNCNSFPCKYGGTCTPDATTSGYTCTCQPGFNGDQCQVRITICLLLFVTTCNIIMS